MNEEIARIDTKLEELGAKLDKLAKQNSCKDFRVSIGNSFNADFPLSDSQKIYAGSLLLNRLEACKKVIKDKKLTEMAQKDLNKFKDGLQYYDQIEAIEKQIIQLTEIRCELKSLLTLDEKRVKAKSKLDDLLC